MHIIFHPEKCDLCGDCMNSCIEQNGINRLRVTSDKNGVPHLNQCRQCEHPACAYACTYELIHRNKNTGAMEVITDECQGCHACLRACPFHAIFPHPVTDVVYICNLCGGTPKCVETCSKGALELK